VAVGCIEGVRGVAEQGICVSDHLVEVVQPSTDALDPLGSGVGVADR
jgi:hypothetical protein